MQRLGSCELFFHDYSWLVIYIISNGYVSLFGKERDLILISCVITAGFAINYFILTPKINKARDAVLAGDEQMEKSFKILHLLSVLIFVVQICLSIFVVVTNTI